MSIDTSKETNILSAQVRHGKDEFDEFMKHIANQYTDKETFEQIEHAYLYAEECHHEQKRRSGEPYILHPIAVARLLSDLRVDSASLIAAILHDVVEDTDATLENINEKFGENVASLVDGLTKLGQIKFRSSQEKLAENFRKMVLAMAKDLRVILIKLADRLHNMRTISFLPEAKRIRIAQETLDIYAPLANRLGIYNIKSELEDLCLRQTKSEIYKDLTQKVAKKKTERQAYIDEVTDILKAELEKYNFKDAIVYGRPKHFFSIYKKMTERQIEFEDIFDLFAFRIVVDTIRDCYEALGLVHAMWKPMPGRFKDYIAMPKANMYQSLHTTVIRPNGEPCEIQIRTKEMHNVCEYGVAAHWAYKEKPKDSSTEALEKFTWLKQIMEWQSELKDPDEFLEAIKVDLFDEEIFVFTPKGDVIQLPQGATALDFSFAVHTEIGSKTIGTKIHGKICPLKTKLQSGDIVEVITSKNQRPNKDWLNFVTTSKARNKIRSFLRSEQREAAKKLGEDLLTQELSKVGINLVKLIKSGEDDKLIKGAREAKLEDVYIAIGYGKITADELIKKVFPRAQEKKDTSKFMRLAESVLPKQFHSKPSKSSTGVLVGGLENVMISIAKCCTPLPGEEIIGFVTRGRGVTIHKRSCSSALDLDPARRISVSWEGAASESMLHTCYLRVITHDKHGVLADVTSAISHCGANIKKAQIDISDNYMGVLDFEITLKDYSQLRSVIIKLENIHNVVSVERHQYLRTENDAQ